MTEPRLLLNRINYCGSSGNSFMKIVPVEYVSGSVLGRVVEGAL